MKLYVGADGRLYVKQEPPPRALVQCTIPGCDAGPMSEADYEEHMFFHPAPVEPEPTTLTAEPDEEGAYTVTSLDPDN